MRVAINLGNASLAQRDPETGELSGVSVALARALSAALQAELHVSTYPGAGKVVADAGADVWDVAFLAIDPKRREVVAYSSPYVLIEAKAVVPAGSSLLHVDELDRDGVSLLVAANSAYDLYLSEHARAMTLVRAETPGASFDGFKADPSCADAVAGVAQSLEKAFGGEKSFRFLEGRITAIEQAMALPIRNAGLVDALTGFVEARKRDGFVREALDLTGMHSLVVADPAA
nr:transporter substrate-binding domain-containing protein [Jiella mangrovi]